MVDEQPTSALINFVSSKLGISSFALTSIATVAGPIIAYQMTYQKAFNDGQSAYEEALRDGTAKLDDKVITLLSDADKAALAELDRIQGEADAAQAAQEALAYQLAEKDRIHAQTIRALAGRSYTPEERDWRDDDVPASTGVRLDAAISAREGGDDRSGLSAPINLAGPVISPTADARSAD